MKGDIKNNTHIIKYPQLDPARDYNPDGTILESKIKDIINNAGQYTGKYAENDNFYIGKNIQLCQEIDVNAPDNEINIPYARTLTHTVKGYMFKPGNITYEDGTGSNYISELLDIFKVNKETLKNAELGERQSKHGVGFEILYAKLNGDTTIPYFDLLDPKEIVPIFDYTIEKNIIAAIRFYCVKSEDKMVKDAKKVEVYYADRIQYFDMIDDGEKVSLTLTDEKENFFLEVPINMYINNNEYMADYEPVKTLLTMLDKLMSDSANELDRFAAAYLVMKNYILAGNDEEANRKLTNLKKLRVFELGEDGDVRFLTKDIPVAFFQEIKNTIKQDIVEHSFIPNFNDESFGTSSGIAIRYKLIGLENLCADKEAYFREGLERRIRLIGNFLRIQKEIDVSAIEIKFKRNLPEAKTEEIDNFKKIDPDGGIVSKRTALGQLGFIDDVGAEIEAINAEKEERIADFNLDKSVPDLNAQPEQQAVDNSRPIDENIENE